MQLPPSGRLIGTPKNLNDKRTLRADLRGLEELSTHSSEVESQVIVPHLSLHCSFLLTRLVRVQTIQTGAAKTIACTSRALLSENDLKSKFGLQAFQRIYAPDLFLCTAHGLHGPHDLKSCAEHLENEQQSTANFFFFLFNSKFILWSRTPRKRGELPRMKCFVQHPAAYSLRGWMRR